MSSVSSSLHVAHLSSTLSLSPSCFPLVEIWVHRWISWQVVAPWCKDEANERQLPWCKNSLMDFYHRLSPADLAALFFRQGSEWEREKSEGELLSVFLKIECHLFPLKIKQCVDLQFNTIWGNSLIREPSQTWKGKNKTGAKALHNSSHQQ